VTLRRETVEIERTPASNPPVAGSQDGPPPAH